MKSVFLFSSFALGTIVIFSNAQSFIITEGCKQSVKPQNTYTLKRHADEFAVFKIQANGNVSEYFLVQGSNWDIQTTSIASAEYYESSDIQLVGENNQRYHFSVVAAGTSHEGNVRTNPVHGIARYRFLSSDGAPLATAESIAFRLSGGTAEPAGCDKGCIAGGCGSTQCSRTLGPAECSVSCNSDRFACCADMVLEGCHCRLNTCCSSGTKN
ncbi:MAG: hypothetical protein ACKVU2_18820 [Saprospiraceae bacterium]